jgi:hypothetical protein
MTTVILGPWQPHAKMISSANGRHTTIPAGQNTRNALILQAIEGWAALPGNRHAEPPVQMQPFGGLRHL